VDFVPCTSAVGVGLDIDCVCLDVLCLIVRVFLNENPVLLCLSLSLLCVNG
jgi:hypothetical protein